MNNIPIIFIHRGDAPYLKDVFAHTYALNRGSDIFLIGDDGNSGHAHVKHIKLDDYSGTAKEFAKVYKHMSTNSYDFELFCFQRWFIINDFVKSNNIEHFLCLDSDVLLFCNVNEIFGNFLAYDFTISQAHSPHCTLFNKESLNRFCDYLKELYVRPEYMERFVQSFKVFQEEQREGGICDMFAFSFYPEDISHNIKELSDLSDRIYFDSNINEPDGFEVKNNLKKIYWRNDLPFGRIVDSGEYVRFYGLHFQGAAKSRIRKYALDKNSRRFAITTSFKRFFGG